jgi:hypothetical protein
MRCSPTNSWAPSVSVRVGSPPSHLTHVTTRPHPAVHAPFPSVDRSDANDDDTTATNGQLSGVVERHKTFMLELSSVVERHKTFMLAVKGTTRALFALCMGVIAVSLVLG